MSRAATWILLGSIPGLMLCIIPVQGIELRFSWQLAIIWLAGIALASILTSWWRRGFFVLALIHTALQWPPNLETYLYLGLVAIGMLAVEGFKRIPAAHILSAMRGAAILLLAWMLMQQAGVLCRPFGQPCGPFNPDAAGVFLALCLPAFFVGNWRLLALAIVPGLIAIRTTTGTLAAASAGAAYFYLSVSGPLKKALITGLFLVLVLGVWFWNVDGWDYFKSNARWEAWRVTARAAWQQPRGHGLGNFANVFPLLVSGSPRLSRPVWRQAHNEYLQTWFEMGLPGFLIIAAFVGWFAYLFLSGRIEPIAAAGMAALIVACAGWHVFHIGPLAVLGCAWLGIFERANARRILRSPFGDKTGRDSGLTEA